MNRKVLSVTFTLLATIIVFASLAGPAQAYSSNGIKKIPVTFTRADPSGVILDISTRGALYVVKAELAFNTYIVEGEGIYLEKQPGPKGITTYRINTDTGIGMALSFGELNFGDGTFKGIIVTKGLFGVVPVGPLAGMPFPLDVTQKGVWHGNGDYQGWTLVLQFATGDDPIEGYILVP